jgi:hypothetical protein
MNSFRPRLTGGGETAMSQNDGSVPNTKGTNKPSVSRSVKASPTGKLGPVLLLINLAILAGVVFQILRPESVRDLIDGHLAELERIDEQLARLQGPDLQPQAPAQQDTEAADTLGDVRNDIRELRSDFVILEAQIQEFLFKQQGAAPR